MLSQFRTFYRTPWAKLLFVLLGVSFVGWGVRGYLNGGGGGDTVVQAGPRSISTARFRQLFQDELKQYNQQSGQTLTLQDAVAKGLDRQVADALASDEALAAYIQRAGVRPSDKQVLGEISKAPRFFNAVSGQFDPKAYKDFVASLGLTTGEFESILRDQLAQTQFVSGMATGLRAPLAFAAVAAAYDAEGRSFDYLVLGPEAVAAPVPPTDQAMQAFIKANAAQLMQPEARGFTVVAFSASKLAQTQAADPAQVQKRFDFEKDSLSKPETRSLVELPVKDAAQGQAAAARLQRGEDVQAVATSLKIKPIAYTDAPRSAIADARVGEIAFAMSPGQVKGPVQGDLGLAVVQLTKATPGHPATLDENRVRIEAEVKQDAAIAAINKQVQAFEAARSGGSSLLAAAKAVGAATSTLPPVTAQGATLQRQKVTIPPKLLQAGFALQPGGDSDVIQLALGEYAALHLDKVVAPSPPPLDEIRPILARVMMQQDMVKRLQAKADTITASLGKGQTLAAAAAAEHVTVQHGEAVPRSAAGKTYGQELLAKLFAARPGEVVTGTDVKPGVVVARLTAVVPASPAGAAQATADGRDATTQGLVQDFAQAVRAGARDAIKPRVDYAKARAALGVEGGDNAPAP